MATPPALVLLLFECRYDKAKALVGQVVSPAERHESERSECELLWQRSECRSATAAHILTVRHGYPACSGLAALRVPLRQGRLYQSSCVARRATRESEVRMPICHSSSHSDGGSMTAPPPSDRLLSDRLVSSCRYRRQVGRMSYEYALLLTVIGVALGMPVLAWVFRKIKHSQDVH
jgi:hypothetical protein